MFKTRQKPSTERLTPLATTSQEERSGSSAENSRRAASPRPALTSCFGMPGRAPQQAGSDSRKPMVVRAAQQFGDASVRADSLVAQRLNAAPMPGTGFVPHQYGPPKYVMKGTPPGVEPHTDSHMHATNYVQVGLLAETQIKLMNQLGVRNSTSMPIPTSLIHFQDGYDDPGMDVFINLPKLQAEIAAKRNEKTSAQGASAEQQGHASTSEAGGSTGADTEHGAGIHDEHPDHHCGPAEFYYVPSAIVEKVEKDRAGTPRAAVRGIELQDFIENPELIKQIVQSSELHIDKSVNAHLALHLKQSGLSEADRSRIDPMITGLHLGDPRSVNYFLKELYLNKGVFTGIGEITLNKELVDNMFAGHSGQASSRTDPNAGFNMQARTQPLIGLLEMAGVVGTPVVLHCDIDSLHSQVKEGIDAQNGLPVDKTRQPDNFEGIKSLFTDERVKNTSLIWAHAGGLGRFIQEGAGHTQRLQALLDECPNLKLDISWSEVAKQLTATPEKMDTWSKFIEKNSHRICFGSDTLAPKDAKQWNETKSMYDALFSNISDIAKQNVLNHTYENTFVAARAKVRSFEKHVLTEDFHNSMLNKPGNPVVSAAFVKAKIQEAEDARRPDVGQERHHSPQADDLFRRYNAAKAAAQAAASGNPGTSHPVQADGV